MKIRVPTFVKEKLGVYQEHLNAMPAASPCSHSQVIEQIMRAADTNFPPQTTPDLRKVTIDAQVKRERPLDETSWVDLEVEEPTNNRLTAWSERHASSAKPGAVLNAAIGMIGISDLLGIGVRP